MSRLRTVQLGFLLALVIASLLPFTAAADSPKARNPYNNSLAQVESQLSSANPPGRANLLARAYELREYVDEPALVRDLMQRVAADPQQHRLVRDEALRYLQWIALDEARLSDAEAALTTLGFVRNWSVVGPFAAKQGLDATYGPEAGLQAEQSYRDSAGRTRRWRALPSSGSQMWNDLLDLYPRTRESVVFAATAVYSDAPQSVALRFSADGGVTPFVNGQPLHAFPAESIGFDQHTSAVRLNAGWNTIVLKLGHSGEGPWRFGLRITGLNGGALSLQSSAEHPGTAPAAANAAQAVDLVDLAKEAADAAQDSATAWETLGLIRLSHGRGNGQRELETAARRSPSAQRWVAVAKHCEESGCAFHALTAALLIDASSEAAQLALADYYFSRGQLEKARDLLREAARREPGDFVARNRLADLYVSVGLNNQALRDSQQLAQEFPAPLWLKRKLAARYLDLGQVEDATTLLRTALLADFADPQTRALLLRAFEKRRDVGGLRALYTDMLRLRPNDTAAMAGIAALDAGAGNYSAASQEFRNALAIAPEDDNLHVAFANMLQSAGNTGRSLDELRAAVESNPNREDALQRLELLSPEHEQPAEDAQYLENPAELAAAARRKPPSAMGNTVTLADVRVEQVHDNGLSTIREQQVYYIATPQGARDFSTRTVQYAPGSQQLRVLHARVYKRDGQVLQAEQTGEGAVADANVAMYYDVRSRMTRFPALEPGDVIELDYRISPTTSVNPYGDYFGGLVTFRSRLPQQLQRYVLITPARRQFNVLEQRMAAATVTARSDQRIYQWEMRNQQALPNEARGPALTDIAPYVHVSTFQSWEDLGRWYAQLIGPQFELDRALQEASARLLKDAHTEQERISAIHHFVLRNTHYVAMEFGVYSYKPYRVSQVYARRFGDCKDKASLMIALLRQAGIEADIALVRTRRLGSVAPQATSIALFNHAIVYVPKYNLWLDGTAEYSGSGELPLEDQGATALTVAADGSASLRQIPVSQPVDNYTRRTVRAQVMGDGRIEFTGVAYTRGEDAPGLRREYEAPERQRDAVQNSLAQIFPSVQLNDVRVQGATDLEHPVTVEFRGELDTFSGQRSIPLAASWMPRSYVQELAALTSRSEDLLLPAPWTTDEELHFQLPEGATVRMPSNTVLDTPFGTARLRYQRNGREVIVSTSVQFRKLRITPAEYAQFRDFCQQVERAFHNEIKIELRG